MKLIVDERDNMSVVHLANVYRMKFFVITISIPAALTKTLSCMVFLSLACMICEEIMLITLFFCTLPLSYLLR